jgi:hypothetical protein
VGGGGVAGPLRQKDENVLQYFNFATLSSLFMAPLIDLPLEFAAPKGISQQQHDNLRINLLSLHFMFLSLN